MNTPIKFYGQTRQLCCSGDDACENQFDRIREPDTIIIESCGKITRSLKYKTAEITIKSLLNYACYNEMNI